jgi:hypothetical protein
MQKLFSTAVALLAVSGLFSPGAQAQSPTVTGPAPAAPTDPAAVPLDGGSSILLASGVVYGLRRLQQRRQRA